MVLLQGLVFGRALLNSLTRRAARASATSMRQPTSHQLRNLRRRGQRRLLHTNPYDPKEIVKRLGGCSVRNLTRRAEDVAPTLDELLKNETWFPVYRFCGIYYAVIAAKVKLLLMLTTAALLPYKTWLYAHGDLPTSNFVAFCSFALFVTAAFAFYCRYFNRLIGVISLDQTNQFVRVGYLSFWGSRRNKFMELEDVMPLNESGDLPEQKLLHFRQYSTRDCLYLPAANVKIVDKERAKLLFGDLSYFGMTDKSS